MKIDDIKVFSGLALIFEKQSPLKDKHLIVASPKNLEKLKSFLLFKPFPFNWYELPPFPYPKAPWTEKALLKRRQFQAFAQDPNSPGLFLASPQALLKKTKPSNFSLLKPGEIFPYKKFKAYRHTEFIERPGDYSSRAFIIDVFSPVYKKALRFELLGDQIQSIHFLDSEFKRRQKSLDKAWVGPLEEWGWDGQSRKSLCDQLRKQEKSLGQFLPKDLYQKISKGLSYFGFEALLNLLDKTSSLDYFTRPFFIYLLNPADTKQSFLNEIHKWEKEQTFFTAQNLFMDGNLLEIATEAKTTQDTSGYSLIKGQKNHYVLFEEVKNQILSRLKQAQNLKLEKSFDKIKSMGSDSLKSQKQSQQIKRVLKNLPVSNLVFAGLKIPEFKQFLQQILSKSDLDFFYQKSLIFIEKPLKESFLERGGTAYLKIEDFFKEKKEQSQSFSAFRKKARALEFSSLEEGDLLVHIQHGLAEFMALQSLNLKGNREDFIVLKYKGGDKLFVPAYRADEIKKYSKKARSGLSKVLLDVLGQPGAWERKKAKAKKHIQSLAIELIELYKTRKQKKRSPFLPVKLEREEFEKDFPWEKTQDQKRAIKDIMSDMDEEYVMDRLLVGDTGFGKTEVALTAVFRALANNYQVCFLAPTTVLSLQHFKNFKQRFKKTPYELALLNRFVSQKEKESLFKKVREGSIDFLIATHSVFNTQLDFKNLGLLVLDEEHRFGVRQKEKLFRFRKNLDVLSLSATPIPRTLNMALTGIKDISVITQAPKERKNVKMILKPWEDSIETEIVERCRQEKARGGQILFIYNRVKSLDKRAEDLSRLLPDFKIALVHGKTQNLDQIILDFFNQKYDLLLSTNIIESGMDIPQANTLFIDRSHEMGLSQIYQLKGRVGRSNKQAYCYLLYPERNRLSPLAKERLNLLETYTYLGSSFQLALYDLENRGAGSLFGSEQSGHIQSLGEEFYFEILNEHLKSQEGLFIEPEISLPFATGIPSDYIRDPRLRLLYYKNLSGSQEEAERLSIRQEIQEDFGKLPQELENLFALLNFREFCKKWGIIDFKLTESFLRASFHKESPVSSQKIVQLLKARQGLMLSQNTVKIPLKTQDLLKECRQILSFFA